MRDAAVVEYKFKQPTITPSTNSGGTRSRSGSVYPNAPSRVSSGTDLPSLAREGTTTALADIYSSSSNAVASGSGSAVVGPSSSRNEAIDDAEEDDSISIDDGIATEVDVVVDVHIPICTTPSHSVHPVFVNHKIKWSAFIR